jgi:hypothetical protein
VYVKQELKSDRKHEFRSTIHKFAEIDIREKERAEEKPKSFKVDGCEKSFVSC